MSTNFKQFASQEELKKIVLASVRRAPSAVLPEVKRKPGRPRKIQQPAQATIHLPGTIETTFPKEPKHTSASPISQVVTRAGIEKKAHEAGELGRATSMLQKTMTAIDEDENSVATKILSESVPVTSKIGDQSEILRMIQEALAGQKAGAAVDPAAIAAEVMKVLKQEIEGRDKGNEEDDRRQDNVLQDDDDEPEDDERYGKNHDGEEDDEAAGRLGAQDEPGVPEQVASPAPLQKATPTQLKMMIMALGEKNEDSDDLGEMSLTLLRGKPTKPGQRGKALNKYTLKGNAGVDRQFLSHFKIMDNNIVFFKGKEQYSKVDAVPITPSVVWIMQRLGNKKYNWDNWQPEDNDREAKAFLTALSKVGWIARAGVPKLQIGDGLATGEGLVRQETEVEDIIGKKNPTHRLDQDAYHSGVLRIYPIRKPRKDGSTIRPKAVFSQKLHPDTHKLLTENYDPRHTYAEKAIAQFRAIDGYIPIKLKKTTVKYQVLKGKTPTTGGGLEIISSDPNDWVSKLQVNLGMIKAGNTNVDLRNDTVQLCDMLAAKGWMTSAEAVQLQESL